MKNYKQEFDRLLHLVKDETPFSFSRFSDGEVTVLRNRTVVLAEDHFIQGDIHGDHKVYANSYMPEEQKSFIPSENKREHEKLVEAFKFKKKNYIKNIDVVRSIIKVFNKTEDEIQFVEDRWGQDIRYSVDISKITKTTGWKPKHTGGLKLDFINEKL